MLKVRHPYISFSLLALAYISGFASCEAPNNEDKASPNSEPEVLPDQDSPEPTPESPKTEPKPELFEFVCRSELGRCAHLSGPTFYMQGPLRQSAHRFRFHCRCGPLVEGEEADVTWWMAIYNNQASGFKRTQLEAICEAELARCVDSPSPQDPGSAVMLPGSELAESAGGGCMNKEGYSCTFSQPRSKIPEVQYDCGPSKGPLSTEVFALEVSSNKDWMKLLMQRCFELLPKSPPKGVRKDSRRN